MKILAKIIKTSAAIAALLAIAITILLGCCAISIFILFVLITFIKN